jgi:hypothetical protein
MFYALLAFGAFRDWVGLPNWNVMALASAMLWWTHDAARRGRPLPLLSISIHYLWLPLALGVHVLRTRGWRRLGKLALHGGATIALQLSSVLLPSPEALRPAPKPSAEQLARWEGYGISANVMVRVEAAGAVVRPLQLRQDNTHATPAQGVMFEYTYTENPWELVAALRRVAPGGETPFVYESANPFTGRGATVAIMRARDVYDVLRAAETNGNNHDVGTEEIIARLKSWDASYGITLSGIGFDWLRLELTRLPPDIQAFAREVYEFCPDTVEQGVADVDALALEIERTRVVQLWWD